ncbi:phosphatase PAP2 family protein [Peterkaempfera bronchialis]|uniref:Phosphatase PAP2 family protein n=1 Tax=Peterkaempfera bronchialis TaxID=2126346 RepID=A0A345SX68_9ACTN|nr:phosphatase PAP2 family protein [Peterkaempfera bronchialis]AXI78323.1 phosphatase PAP2 family protein [Peterkaempfera bronchialis]
MLTLPADGSNPDLSLLYDVNGLAKDAPSWVDGAVSWIGEYGILLGLGLLCLTAWLRARRQPDAPVAVAAVAWAPLAAAVAAILNIPIRALVARPRPFVEHTGLDVLASGKDDFSFASDHATLTMAIAVALLLAERRLGVLAVLFALLQGFCRVYMGVHYPTDVLGGYALGTAVVLLLAPPATAVLVPLCRSLARTAAAPLVAARGRRDGAAQAPYDSGSGTGHPGSGIAA